LLLLNCHFGQLLCTQPLTHQHTTVTKNRSQHHTRRRPKHTGTHQQTRYSQAAQPASNNPTGFRTYRRDAMIKCGQNWMATNSGCRPTHYSLLQLQQNSCSSRHENMCACTTCTAPPTQHAMLLALCRVCRLSTCFEQTHQGLHNNFSPCHTRNTAYSTPSKPTTHPCRGRRHSFHSTDRGAGQRPACSAYPCSRQQGRQTVSNTAHLLEQACNRPAHEARGRPRCCRLNCSMSQAKHLLHTCPHSM
jgi:hypothetical protein